MERWVRVELEEIGERGPAGKDATNGEHVVMKPLDDKITLVVHNTLGNLQTVRHIWITVGEEMVSSVSICKRRLLQP